MPETVNELNTTKEECIEKFRNATFGEEVRGALIDLANLVYTDVINAALSGLKKGDSITNVSIQNGDLILEITSYDIDSDTSAVTTKNLGNIIGPTGQDGPIGPMGPQGNSITAVNVDSNGDLYVTIGSGTPTLIGNIKGPKGDTGATGPKGDPGDVGPEHEWSIDGSLSSTSENPVQNRAIYNELQGKQDKLSSSDVNEITVVGNRGQIKASGRTINYESTLNPVSYNSIPTEGTVASYTYSKTESDARFAGQTDLNNYYNKNESDTKYLSKNDANNNYYTRSQSDNKYLTEHQDISGKQNKLSPNSAGKVTVVGNNGAIKATNFSIDDIEISELASQTITTHDKVANYTYSKTESDNKYVQLSQIDQELNDESNNPVTNSAITQKIEQIENDYSAPDPTIDITSTKPVQNHAVAEALNGKVNISDFKNTIFDEIDVAFSNTNGGIYYNGDCPAAPALFIEAEGGHPDYPTGYVYYLSYVDSLDNEQWHRIANITLLVDTIISIDSALDPLSTRPVENKVVTKALDNKYEYKIINDPINNIAGLNGYTDENKIYIVDCNFQPIDGKAKVIFVKSNDPQPGLGLYPNSAQFIFTESGNIFVRTTDIAGAFYNLQLFNRGLQVDEALSTTSENPVQNKVIKAAIDEVVSHGVIIDDHMSTSSTNPVQNRIISLNLTTRESKTNKDDSLSELTSDTYDRTHYPSIKCLKTVQNAIPTVPTNVSSFTNDAGYLTQHQSLANYYTKTEVNDELDTMENWANGRFLQSSDIAGKENTSNKVTSISSSSTNTEYPSALAVKNYVDTVIRALYGTVTVSKNLTHISINNTDSSTVMYQPYTAVLSADRGYSINEASVTVIMGGLDITADCYSNGIISIPKVIEAISITAAGIYVNQITQAKDTIGGTALYNGTGYKQDYFWTSDNTESNNSIIGIPNKFAVGYIELEPGDIVHFYGDILKGTTGWLIMHIQSVNDTRLVRASLSNWADYTNRPDIMATMTDIDYDTNTNTLHSFRWTGGTNAVKGYMHLGCFGIFTEGVTVVTINSEM